MKKLDDELIIQFTNDDEFTDWALCPSYQIVKDDTGRPYYDVPFTKEYLDAIDAGYRFEIMKNDSMVIRRGCVCRGIITKPVENLITYNVY
jgi:hypothetical protein